LLQDLLVDGQEFVAAKGRRAAGKCPIRDANTGFRAMHNREKGEERWLRIELKLLLMSVLIGYLTWKIYPSFKNLVGQTKDRRYPLRHSPNLGVLTRGSTGPLWWPISPD
jgi:hypothetical protein